MIVHIINGDAEPNEPTRLLVQKTSSIHWMTFMSMQTIILSHKNSKKKYGKGI